MEILGNILKWGPNSGWPKRQNIFYQIKFHHFPTFSCGTRSRKFFVLRISPFFFIQKSLIEKFDTPTRYTQMILGWGVRRIPHANRVCANYFQNFQNFQIFTCTATYHTSTSQIHEPQHWDNLGRLSEYGRMDIRG